MFDKLLHKAQHAAEKHLKPQSDAGPIPGPPQSVPRPNGRISVGYFANWDIYDRKYQVKDIPAQYLTHILYAFANVKKSGQVFLSDEWADEQIKMDGDPAGEHPKSLMGNLGQLYRLKQQHRHLKVLLSVGGWSFSSSFKKPASSPSGRQTFAESCVQLVENYGFDGIDIDWEYPSNDGEAWDYVALLAAVRHALDGLAAKKGLSVENGYELSIAAPAGASTYEVLRVREMDPYLSFWNVMAYDYSGSWESSAYHQAAVFDQDRTKSCTDRALRFYANNGVRSEKLIVGVPLYGRSFTGTHGAGHPFKGVGKGSYEEGVYDYRDLPLHGSEVQEDMSMLTSWCHNAQTGEWVSFDTPGVARAKADFIAHHGLGGAMFWEVSGDRNDEYAIIPATAHALAPLDDRENHLDYDSVFDNV